MPIMDSTARAALAGQVICPAFFIFLDVAGDPVRITTFGKDITFASTGDADLDGNTFKAFDARAIQVGDVANSESGSDTLTVDLSGIVTIDTTLLGEIGDKTKWQGRTCRLWFAIYAEDGATQQGAVVPYYTGYMSSVGILPSPETQTIRLNVENYLAAFNDASFRSYLNQKDYDASDASAAATIASANGVYHGPGSVAPTYPDYGATSGAGMGSGYSYAGGSHFQ